MKLYAVPLPLLVGLLLTACAPILEMVQGVRPEPSSIEATEGAVITGEADGMQTRINLQIGDRLFTARLLDNPASQVFVAMLPLTMTMIELNRNEKYYNLPGDLSANSERVGTINSGDLMLYGSNTLVLFYESFNSAYSYTRLGYIEDAFGLANTLGSGNVEITFSLAD